MMMGLGLWEFAEEVVSMRMYTCTSAWVFWGGLVSGRGPTAVDEPHCYKTERLRRIALETRCGRIFTLQISNPETLINLAHHATNVCMKSRTQVHKPTVPAKHRRPRGVSKA